MMERYRHLHRIILMVVLQGGFPGSYSQDWALTLPESIRALRGSCVVIPCTFTLPRGYGDFNMVWYIENHLQPDNKIFSQQNPSDVSEGYRGRTSLVGNEPNSCSLRINDVQENGTYYPYIYGNCLIISECEKVQVTVSDVPSRPGIQIPTDLTEGVCAPIPCSVEHTCPPRPPTLQWNTAGYKLTDRQQSLKDGVWKAESVMEYLPSYRDHGAELECEATYPNGLRSKSLVTLNINYSPKKTVIIISDGKKERKEGDAVNLTCASDANPAANAFTWYNNKRDGTVELREEQGRSITVTVGRGRETFSCTARNPLGTGNSTLSELQVLYKAKNVTIEGKDEVKEGAALELECHFSDYNPPTTQYSYSWYLNGNPVNGETGRILQINNITESHSGNYSCNVQNRAGPSYSPGFAVTVMSAPTGEGLPMSIILGGGAGAVLVILLALGLYLFLRAKKSQKGGESGGWGAETDIQNSQPTESPYTALQTRDTAVYYGIKNSQPTESPYTAQETRDPAVYYIITKSQPTESPYTALQTRDTAVYYMIENPQATESLYTALQTRDTAVYEEIKPQIHQQNRSK
ncbi:B-cell receptor CD22-like isoform X3 [Xenopus tropicalis]|nr:B-cell receptor CD22-like isoform X3 [Xenopus tropicalis]